MMEIIYASLIGALGIIAGLAVAFFQGRKAGKTESKIEQWEVIAEVKEKVKESDNAVNSQDRANIISGLTADSVRRAP